MAVSVKELMKNPGSGVMAQVLLLFPDVLLPIRTEQKMGAAPANPAKPIKNNEIKINFFTASSVQVLRSLLKAQYLQILIGLGR